MPFLCVLRLRLRFGFCVFLYFNHIPIDVLSALSLYTDTSAHARTHRLKVLVGFFLRRVESFIRTLTSPRADYTNEKN